MPWRGLLIAVVLWAAAAPSLSASAMTVQQFMTIAEGIPRNPTAMFRADTRRLIEVVKRAVLTVKTEQAAAAEAGGTPATCIPPSGTGITAQSLMARFEGLPAARRGATVTQAVRDWMIERYPCPA